MKPPEDIELFASHCAFIRSIYMEKILFESSIQAQKEIMKQTAPVFSYNLNKVFREFLILEVCKITESAKSGKNHNLTIEFLLQHYDFTEPQKQEELQALNKKTQAFRSKLAPARNKLISHSDRAAILDGRSLGGAPDSDWNEFWLDLDAFISVIYRKVWRLCT